MKIYVPVPLIYPEKFLQRLLSWTLQQEQTRRLKRSLIIEPKGEEKNGLMTKFLQQCQQSFIQSPMEELPLSKVSEKLWETDLAPCFTDPVYSASSLAVHTVR